MEIQHGNGNKYVIASVIVIALFFLIRFGITGLRTIIGLIIVIFVPVYLILRSFELDILERIVLSIFLGIGLISTIVYFLGLVMSFRVGILIAFLGVLITGIIMNKLTKTTKNDILQK